MAIYRTGFLGAAGTASTVSATTSYGSLSLTASGFSQYGVTITFNNTVGAGIGTILVNGAAATLVSGDPTNLVSGTNTFVLKLPKAGTNYTVQITTNNGYQGSVTFTSSPYIPSQPQIVTVKPGYNSIYLEWGEVAYATTYNVLLNGKVVGSSTSTSYTFTGLLPHTAYTVGVQAVAPDAV